MSASAIADHLWQSTVFALAASLLVLACRRNRAAVRYALWFTASVKFVVPFAPLLELGRHLKWATLPQIAAPPAAWPIAQVSAPFSAARASETLPMAVAPSSWIDFALLGIWACGFLAIALIRVRGRRAVATVMRSSSPMRLSDVAIPPGITVRAAPGLMEPGVVGIWRPCLLLPVGIERHLTVPELSAVIAHELSHARRRDNATAVLQMIVEALFWFHPLVWWIGARLVHERERACDEEVLRLGTEPQVYAESIVKTCRRYVESSVLCVAGVTGSNLRKRIDANHDTTVPVCSASAAG